MTDAAAPAPTVFESFNARNLEPAEVARTFTPPRQYSQLVKPTHALVVGPRGSGKTTLLKMLQGAALEAWRHPRADEFRSRVTFTGVFIPTDVSWNAQLWSLGGSSLTSDEKTAFAVSSFTVHVLRQLVTAIHYRVSPSKAPDLTPHRRVSFDPNRESQLVQEIATQWMLTPQLPSLLALRRSLTTRLIEIGSAAATASLLNNRRPLDQLLASRYITFPFLESSAFAIDVFEQIGERPKEKWALLFDELELAPDWLRRQLMAYLRSTDDRFLFKLSLSPYTEDSDILDRATSPMPGQDFEPISLWYAHKEQGFGFCRSLLRSMLHELGKGDIDPIDLFGRSEFETPTSEWLSSGSAYQRGSRLHRRFKNLYAIDGSFRTYLRANGIDPNRLSELEGTQRAAEIRKITSIVAVRETFRAPDRTPTSAPSARLRSRKNPDLYSGAASLFAMVEGNPRWFIGIIGSLLRDHYLENASISPAVQTMEITKAANRFRALLRSLPSSAQSVDQPRGVLSILDPIGKYFFRATVVDDFNPDPPGSFILDANTSGPLLSSLGRALNSGAIVYVPDRDGEVVLGSLRGKRFRISYLLASHYRIPIRLGREISLSRILSGPAPSHAPSTPAPRLFND